MTQRVNNSPSSSAANKQIRLDGINNSNKPGRLLKETRRIMSYWESGTRDRRDLCKYSSSCVSRIHVFGGEIGTVPQLEGYYSPGKNGKSIVLHHLIESPPRLITFLIMFSCEKKLLPFSDLEFQSFFVSQINSLLKYVVYDYRSDL